MTQFKTELGQELTDEDVANMFSEGVKGLSKVAVTEQQPAPFVYRTATTDAARELISKRDMLLSLIAEDSGELDYLAEAHAKAIEQQNAAYAEARAMVEARRMDRLKAANAYTAVIDGLQENRS